MFSSSSSGISGLTASSSGSRKRSLSSQTSNDRKRFLLRSKRSDASNQIHSNIPSNVMMNQFQHNMTSSNPYLPPFSQQSNLHNNQSQQQQPSMNDRNRISQQIYFDRAQQQHQQQQQNWMSQMNNQPEYRPHSRNTAEFSSSSSSSSSSASLFQHQHQQQSRVYSQTVRQRRRQCNTTLFSSSSSNMNSSSSSSSSNSSSSPLIQQHQSRTYSNVDVQQRNQRTYFRQQAQRRIQNSLQDDVSAGNRSSASSIRTDSQNVPELEIPDLTLENCFDTIAEGKLPLQPMHLLKEVKGFKKKFLTSIYNDNGGRAPRGMIHCGICKERFFDTVIHLRRRREQDYSCAKCGKNDGKFSCDNDMDPWKRLDHLLLPKLSDIEEMLISLVHSHMRVYRLKGEKTFAIYF
jgi:hypothetical protein